MSFLTETVTIPVWLLILMIGGLIPLFMKMIELFSSSKWRKSDRETESREESDRRILLKLRTLKKAAPPSKSVLDVAKEKKQEKKADILHVLKIMAAEGDKGVLLKAIADQLNINTSKVQQAMVQLTDKNLVEEVTGVSGTKYYLTDVGKKYCIKKGFARGH